MVIVQPQTLAAQRVVVVAPHPDDESLGCGGLIAALAQERRRVLVVFITDGGASHLGSATWSRARLARRRRREGLTALRRLGLNEADAVFLGLRDADMPSPGSAAYVRAVGRMATVFRTFHPDLALLPWRRDPHCDHRAAWAMASSALASLRPAPDRLEYAIWLDELGADEDYPRAGEAEMLAFDVSAGLVAKRAAVAAHLTQTTALIDDAPAAFRLTSTTIDRLCGPVERYWRVAP